MHDTSCHDRAMIYSLASLASVPRHGRRRSQHNLSSVCSHTLSSTQLPSHILPIEVSVLHIIRPYLRTKSQDLPCNDDGRPNERARCEVLFPTHTAHVVIRWHAVYGIPKD